MENDNYGWENIKTSLYESDNPLLFVITVPNYMTKLEIKALSQRFADFKKQAGIDIPFVILHEGVTLSLIEKPK
jgi:hypothetical protein